MSSNRHSSSSLVDRFEPHLERLGIADPDLPLVVAVSGGCDSVVLLHLLRFATRPRPRLSAAHFDHAMRPDSRADAEWVSGLCAAWRIPLTEERATRPLRGETQAREERYRYLRHVAAAVPGTRILTAHHADDQAETVLFRILRGTGLHGLAGIRSTDSSGLVRPLLPFWRSEIRRYARDRGLRWREDTSNRSVLTPRNRIRNELLPKIEETVAPGARRSLVGLAEIACEAEAGLDAALGSVRAAAVREEGTTLLLDRATIRHLHPALATRLLRECAHRLGSSLSRAGTRLAMQFITDAHSGRELELPGGVRLRTEFDTVRLERNGESPADRPVRLDDPDRPGDAPLLLGGRSYRVTWGPVVAVAAPAVDQHEIVLASGAADFPLELRAWRPGDRVRLASGTRRLKKLFGDHRVPLGERRRIPILVDRAGRVLWIAGVARAQGLLPAIGEAAIRISVRDD